MKDVEDGRWSDVWGFESGFIKFSLSQPLPTQKELYALSLYLFFIAVCLCVEPKILWYLQREFRLSSFIPEDGCNMFHHNVRIIQHHCTLYGPRKLQSSYGGLFVILVTQFHPWIQYVYVVIFLFNDVAVYRWIHFSVEFLHGSTHDRNSDCFNPMLKHLGL
jgi:hypothetical protein